jgi:hypothetical protein
MSSTVKKTTKFITDFHNWERNYNFTNAVVVNTYNGKNYFLKSYLM